MEGEHVQAHACATILHPMIDIMLCIAASYSLVQAMISSRVSQGEYAFRGEDSSVLHIFY